MAGGPWGAFFKGGIHKGPQRQGPAFLDRHTHCSEATGSTVPWKNTPGAPELTGFRRACCRSHKPRKEYAALEKGSPWAEPVANHFIKTLSCKNCNKSWWSRKKSKLRRGCKKIQMQGAQTFKNEAYLQVGRRE